MNKVTYYAWVILILFIVMVALANPDSLLGIFGKDTIPSSRTLFNQEVKKATTFCESRNLTYNGPEEINSQSLPIGRYPSIINCLGKDDEIRNFIKK